jgi:hypothetical protein
MSGRSSKKLREWRKPDIYSTILDRCPYLKNKERDFARQLNTIY